MRLPDDGRSPVIRLPNGWWGARLRPTRARHVPETGDLRRGRRRERRFVVARKGTDDSAILAKLTGVRPLSRSQVVVEREFAFQRGGPSTTRPPCGRCHIHLAPFQVQGSGPCTSGWMDTVDLGSGDQAEVLLHFDGYRGKYVFHCHNLEHEDMMMANFRVH